VCIFRVYGGQNHLGGLSPNFFGSRRNHVFQIWWRSVKGFSVGWGSNFAISHDLRSGYHQVAMNERDEDKTSVTRNGTFCLSVIPFGLCNGPVTFLWLMGCTIRGLNYDVCLIYLDDIIVSVPNVATHTKVRYGPGLCLWKTSFKFKPSKCSFLQRRKECSQILVQWEN